MERDSPADSNLQDLHDTRKQQHNQEETRWEFNIDDFTKARDLETDHFASEDVGEDVGTEG